MSDLSWFDVLGREVPLLCPLLEMVGTVCLLQAGEKCKDNDECAAHWCYNNECLAPKWKGETCYEDLECVSQWCLIETDAPTSAPTAALKAEPRDPETAVGGGIRGLQQYTWISDEAQLEPRSLKKEELQAGECMDPPLEIGQYCEENDDCREGACEFYDCFFFLIFNCWNVCVAPEGTGQVGDFCTHESQCESGVCAESSRVGDYECKAASGDDGKKESDRPRRFPLLGWFLELGGDDGPLN